MITVFTNVVIPVLVVFLLGFILGKSRPIDLKPFSTISLYLLTPALIFHALYQFDSFFTIDSLKIFLAISATVAAATLVVEILYRILKFSRSTRTVLILTITLSNSGNFGLPICEFAYGKPGLHVASLLLVIYSFYTHTFGAFVAASDKGGRKQALFDMLKIPVFYAMVAALILQALQVKIPGQILDPIGMVGYAAIPLNLLQLGITLAKTKGLFFKPAVDPVPILPGLPGGLAFLPHLIGRWIGRLTALRFRPTLPLVLSATVAKLVLIPAAAYLLLSASGVSGLSFNVSMVQAAMPSAIYAPILAAHFGSDDELAGAIVFVSLLGSVLSLTVWIWALG